jgi:hypothetical protein
MGDHPKPVDDDIERALASMRAGFLSGSEQIATHIASLDAHLVNAPSEEREAVRAQVARLVASHDRITARVTSAPASAWDSFKIMVSAVKQQQNVLDEVSHLVKEHVLPRQLESLAAAAAPPPEEPPPPHPLPEAPPPPRRAPSSPRRHESGYRALTRAGMRTRSYDDEPERPSLLAMARERTAGFRGLAAMLAVGIILSMLPRERLQEIGAKLFELLGPAAPEIASDDPPSKSLTPPVATRSVDRIPSAADAAADKAEPEPPKAAPPARKKAVVAKADEAPPPQVPPKVVPTPTASAEPVAPPPAEERFVPVVFTHKDHATVVRALSDLKQQYPNILIGLEGEVQPIDLGKKGIWHRLVFLPPGPRPQATKICDQLAAHGYDRCWVKEY